MPQQKIALEMCEWFNPLLGYRCEKKHETGGNNLECHAFNPDCPDYKPTEYERTHIPTS